MLTNEVDFLVIGSGMAGLSCAIKLASHGSVALVTKKELAESNTNYAQGGIAAVLAEDDSFDAHAKDTKKAGGGLCHDDAVKILVENGPQMIKDLIGMGVKFSSSNDNPVRLDLGREGGHTRRRIVHAKDLTGAEIERVLVNRAKESSSIEIFENHMAVDLVHIAKFQKREEPIPMEENRCIGAYVMDRENSEIFPIKAKATILATGGSGKVYLYTSNPDIASGDGVALAYRLGAKIANMEFMQFHPTCLYHPFAKSFLISEAVRGEGAELKLSDCSSFMHRYHDMGSLAPRDVVARAIDMEMKRRGDDFVYLDTTMIDPITFTERFPNIYKECSQYGYDPTKVMLPVVPAAHYMCGGVAVDCSAKTSIPGLFAIGETAHTGVHGANRLASNSLLEAIVFANLGSDAIVEWNCNTMAYQGDIPAWDHGLAVDPDEEVIITHLWDEIRRLMWNYVGIVRTNKRLERAKRRIELINDEINEYYWNIVITTDLLELRNLAIVAKLIIDCAMKRKESRGLHYNLDFPQRDDSGYLGDTIIEKQMPLA
ncbi:MAG TPA: L-aspartate oxidase [Nitrospinota bacterium]|nr:L-aspartate oxidase [Nitrospinota bacterium]|tara:strand:+ start:32255 stop:33883 length:1629 start_codon:yes stop_codon:yes gene_type:complete